MSLIQAKITQIYREQEHYVLNMADNSNLYFPA